MTKERTFTQKKFGKGVANGVVSPKTFGVSTLKSACRFFSVGKDAILATSVALRRFIFKVFYLLIIHFNTQNVAMIALTYYTIWYNDA